jgi:phage terminase large subunit-like protein
MKQYRQSHIRIGWLVASAIALASAGALAADIGNVNSGGRSVNEVLGRASGSLPGIGVRAVNTTALPPVSEVYGRGNQMSGGAGAAIGTGAMDVGDFGRGSGTLAAAHGKHGASDVSVASTK